MTAKGRKRHAEPWRELLAEGIEDPGSTNGKPAAPGSSDDLVELDASPELMVIHRRGGLDDVADIDDHGRKYVVEQAPLPIGNDGDDDPEYTQPKEKISYRAELGPDQPVQRGDIVEPVRVKSAILDNPVAQLLEAGHGFSVDDRRSRPWKTAPRTHCAHCGGPMPTPNVSSDKRYRCEFDADASQAELALVGHDLSRESDGWPFRPIGCECSGCKLRWLVSGRHERNRGNPAKCCSKECARLRDNERAAWKRAVVSAEKRGEEPPAAPEDKGLKFVWASGLRSSSEGTGRRYSAATGHRWELPRA